MKANENKNKEFRITFRLNEAELETLNTKIAEAGYQSAGAFIRDFVANSQVKPKVGQNVVQIARELMKLASMIKADRPGCELLEKVKYIAQVNMGGVK